VSSRHAPDGVSAGGGGGKRMANTATQANADVAKQASAASSLSSTGGSSVATIAPVIKGPHNTHIVWMTTPTTLVCAAVIGTHSMDPSECVSFMRELLRSCAAYLTNTGSLVQLTPAVITQHFATVLQLVEEQCDGGLPFRTHMNHLTSFIPPPSMANRLWSGLSGASSIASTLQESSVPWRRGGVTYTRNEVKFDLVEMIDVTVSPTGSLAKPAIRGKLVCKCRLSGEPELTVALNTPAIVWDMAMHPCVRVKVWEQTKTLSFLPPDGDTVIAEFRIDRTVRPALPLYVNPRVIYEEASSRLKVELQVGTKFLQQASYVGKVTLSMQLPHETVSTTLSADAGSVNVDLHSGKCTWTVGRLEPAKSPILSGFIILRSGTPKPAKMPLVHVRFECEKFSASGLKVSTVSVAHATYTKLFKGYRSVTQAGSVLVESTASLTGGGVRTGANSPSSAI
jgi:AP-3 complex subunit mu